MEIFQFHQEIPIQFESAYQFCRYCYIALTVIPKWPLRESGESRTSLACSRFPMVAEIPQRETLI